MNTKASPGQFFKKLCSSWQKASWVRKTIIILAMLVVLDWLRPPPQQFTAGALITGIELYQRYVSKGIMEAKGIKICRYTPTCSEYTKQALAKYGLFKGSLMGMYRIVRCNPWSQGGEDQP
jgi:putative membrane protein insertion efficiency factor